MSDSTETEQPAAPAAELTSAASLWLVMMKSYRSIQTFIESTMEAMGIGLSDFMILEALLHKGPMTMTALCDAALLANASMTSAIDRLEEKKFVERTADKTDRRVRLVRAVREVQACDVDAGQEQLAQDLRIAGRRSDRRHDLGPFVHSCQHVYAT